MHGTKQRKIEFGAAEGQAAERRNLLGLALMRVECDLHLAVFVNWVHNVTGGGAHRQLLKSYAELARRPHGLCCSEMTARRTVERAIKLGLVRAEATFCGAFGQRGNAYTICWEGVQRLLGIGKLGGLGPGVHSVRPGVQNEQGGVQNEQGGVQNEQPIKEIPSFLLPSCLLDVVDDDVLEARIKAAWPAVVEATNAARRALGWERQPLDWEGNRFLLGAAIVAVAILRRPRWLSEAAEITERGAKTNQQAYLRATLIKRLFETEQLCKPNDCEALFVDLMQRAAPLVERFFDARAARAPGGPSSRERCVSIPAP